MSEPSEIEKVNLRLSEWLDGLDETATKVMEKTGIATTTFYSIQKPGNAIKHEYIVAFVDKYGLDPAWLFGKAKSGTRTEYPSENQNALVSESHTEHDLSFIEIPFYPNVKASAGGGLVPDESKPPLQLKFRSYYIKEKLRASADNLVVINATGDSMEPVIHDGDAIMIDRSRKKPKGVMVIRIDEDVQCKFLQELPGRRFRIMSQNQSYESFEIDADQDGFEIIGQVVWHAESLV